MNYTDRLRKTEWYVGDCPLDRARRLIVAHHYAAGAANTASACHGLYRRADHSLFGAAWWMPPIRAAAAAVWDEPTEVLALSRLVLVPGTPKNAATFLIRRSVKLLPARWRCLLTYADTMQGHDGGIYRSSGWEYRGMTEPEAAYKREGRLVCRKAGPKTRTRAEMLALGCEHVGDFAKHRFRLVRNTRIRPRREPEQPLPLFGLNEEARP